MKCIPNFLKRKPRTRTWELPPERGERRDYAAEIRAKAGLPPKRSSAAVSYADMSYADLKALAQERGVYKPKCNRERLIALLEGPSGPRPACDEVIVVD